MRNIKRAAHLY